MFVKSYTKTRRIWTGRMPKNGAKFPMRPYMPHRVFKPSSRVDRLLSLTMEAISQWHVILCRDNVFMLVVNGYLLFVFVCIISFSQIAPFAIRRRCDLRHELQTEHQETYCSFVISKDAWTIHVLVSDLDTFCSYVYWVTSLTRLRLLRQCNSLEWKAFVYK